MPPSAPPDNADERDDRPDVDRIVQNVIPSERLEHGLVGECLITIHTPDKVPFLQPEHFWSETARAAWKGMIELRKEGCALDVLTVAEHLTRTAHVPYVDWESWLIRASNDPVPLNIQNFERDARTLLDYARRREHIREHEQKILELSDLTVPLPESGLVSMAGVVHTAEEAFEDMPPVDWLVKMILAPGMVVLIYGKPATKKTYCLFFLAACVALHKDWAGFETRQANVLIVDQESGHRRIQRRMLETLNGALGDATAPIYWVTMQGYKLSNRADIAKIKQMIIELHIELVIIDSLSKHSAGDENSANEMSAEMEGARELAHNPDTAVVLIHHSKKGDDKFRGSSAIEASVDMMIRVESQEGSRFVNFAMEKNRDGELLKWSVRATWVKHKEALEKDQFYLERVENQKEVKREEEEETSKSGARDYVIRYLREHGESELQAIMDAAEGCSRYSAKNAVYALVQQGVVRKASSPGGAKTRSSRYSLMTGEPPEQTSSNPGQS